MKSVIDPSTNSISDEALEIVKMFDTYTEISPSGYGLHMIIKADPHIPLPHNKYEMKQNGIVRIKKETGEAKIPEVEFIMRKDFSHVQATYGVSLNQLRNAQTF